MRRGFVLVLSMFSVFCTPFFAYAVTVDPQASDLNVWVGEEAQATIVVRNDSMLPKEYSVTFVETSFGDNAEDLTFTAISAQIAGQISATPNAFTLSPDESKIVTIFVQLSEAYEPKSRTIGVLVTEKGIGSLAGTVQTSVASLLFLHMPNALETAYAVLEFSVHPPVSFGKPLLLSALYENTGEDTVLLTNELRVFGPLGREVGRYPFAFEAKHLPEGSMRSLSTSWPSENGFSGFYFGKYRFELWEDEGSMLALTTAWYVPTVGIIVLCGVLTLLLLGILMGVRRSH